jgi:hypothetical protein
MNCTSRQLAAIVCAVGALLPLQGCSPLDRKEKLFPVSQPLPSNWWAFSIPSGVVVSAKASTGKVRIACMEAFMTPTQVEQFKSLNNLGFRHDGKPLEAEKSYCFRNLDTYCDRGGKLSSWADSTSRGAVFCDSGGVVYVRGAEGQSRD